MPNLANWVSQNRAADAWVRINEKPTSIVVVRGATNLAAQIVRLEANNTTTEITGAAGSIVSAQRSMLFGVRGLTGVTDTNIKKGDKFAAEGVIYRVLSVILQTGEIQALCEVSS